MELEVKNKGKKAYIIEFMCIVLFSVCLFLSGLEYLNRIVFQVLAFLFALIFLYIFFRFLNISYLYQIGPRDKSIYADRNLLKALPPSEIELEIKKRKGRRYWQTDALFSLGNLKEFATVGSADELDRIKKEKGLKIYYYTVSISYYPCSLLVFDGEGSDDDTPSGLLMELDGEMSDLIKHISENRINL